MGTEVVIWDGIPFRKHVILADVNIPYKLSIDRLRNNLFFCINADEYTDQSFQSVYMNLDTGLVGIIPGIQNGFASAVNQTTGDVYLGGSNGIYQYDYVTNDVVKTPIVKNMDIFDMFFHEYLYFVDTCTQGLHIYKDKRRYNVKMHGNLVHHFVIDAANDLYFVNRSGLNIITKENYETPVLLDANYVDIRAAAVDVNGIPYFIANDGIYSINKDLRVLRKILPVKNGNGLAFDKHNNMIFCEDRSIVALFPN